MKTELLEKIAFEIATENVKCGKVDEYGEVPAMYCRRPTNIELAKK